MNKYKCVIFDCDGVLVDSEKISNQVLVDMANEYGANIDIEYALKHFKGSFIDACVEKIRSLATKPLSNKFIEAYRERSYAAFQKNIEPVEGITAVLENLKSPFCVASSGPEYKIELNLKLTGLLPYFENKIFSCYTINKWKPDPAVFLWAAETMGFKPEECVVVEDSISGVKAARAGGFDVFGYIAHDYNNELKTEATRVFNSMPELLEMV